MSINELKHHGVPGMHWGIRRYQNEDGSLTPEGKERYSESLSNLYDNDNDDYDGDYTLSKGSSIFRRTSSIKDGDADGKKYTYTYDYDNSDDDNFYKQFGKRVTEYTLADDAVLAGKKAIGKAFIDKMLTLDNEEDISAMDSLYYDCSKRGSKYVDDLFSMPYEPTKHMETLEAIGSDMVSRMLSAERHDKLDAKLQKKGFRDPDTAANDIGRDIVDKLLTDGYSGMRDYNDYGSAANVVTPTIIFDPDRNMHKLSFWDEEN